MSSRTECTAKLDRWCFAVGTSAVKLKEAPPSIPGFQICRDSFVEPQSRIATYGRVRSLENPETGTKVFLQYRRKHGWLKHVLGTVIANDDTGILLPDLHTIGKAFREDVDSRLVELAFDFTSASGVDKEFVLKHGLFGKSRPTHDPQFQDQLRYGTRHSAKLVRAYFKRQVNAFRVEIELHATWGQLPQGYSLLHTLPLSSKDFRFVDVDWKALDAYLDRKFQSDNQIVADARRHYSSLHELLTFLTAVGVNNPHYFLRRSEKDPLIWQAFDLWKSSFTPGLEVRR